MAKSVVPVLLNIPAPICEVLDQLCSVEERARTHMIRILIREALAARGLLPRPDQPQPE